MRVEGTYRFPASQERVYALLLDPTVLAGCIPGCERLEAAGEDHYEATVKVGVGAVRGTYKGDVRIVDQQAPQQYRMLVQGRGGPGFIKGEASVRIVPAGDAECDVDALAAPLRRALDIRVDMISNHHLPDAEQGRVEIREGQRLPGDRLALRGTCEGGGERERE